MLTDSLGSPRSAVSAPWHQGPDAHTSRNNPTSDGGSGNGAHLAVNLGPRRSTAIAAVSAVAVLLLAGYALLEMGSGAASPVVLSADMAEKNWAQNTTVYFAITLENTDDEWSSQTVKLYANWLSGNPWAWNYTRSDGAPLDPVHDHEGQLLQHGVVIPMGASTEVWFIVDIPDDTAGVSQQVIITGIDNFGRVDGNLTKQEDDQDLILTINSVQNFNVDLRIDSTSWNDDRLMYGGETINWDYVVENTGGLSATFNVVGEAPAGWDLDTGFTPDTEIPGTVISDVAHLTESTMTITSPESALPGSYVLKLTATAEPAGGRGVDDMVVVNRTFTVNVPPPDLVLVDLTFSSDTTNIPASGDIIPVTLFATIMNMGGNTDAAGNPVTQVDVWFTVDGATVGSVVYIDELNHGESATVNVTYTPAEQGEVEVEVRVDAWNNREGENPADRAIIESDEDNNDLSNNYYTSKDYVAPESTNWYLGVFACCSASLMIFITLLAFKRRHETEHEDSKGGPQP